MLSEEKNNSTSASTNVRYTSRLLSVIINNIVPVIHGCSSFENSICSTFSSIYNSHYSHYFISAWSSIKSKFNFDGKNKGNSGECYQQKPKNINKFSIQPGVGITFNDSEIEDENTINPELKFPAHSNIKYEKITVDFSTKFTCGEIIKSGTSGNNLLDEAAFNNNVSQMKIFLPIVIQEKGWQYILELRNNKGVNFLNIAYDNRNAAVLNEVMKICHLYDMQYISFSNQQQEVTVASNRISQFVQQQKANALEIRFEEFAPSFPTISSAETYVRYHQGIQPIRGEYQFFSNGRLLLGNSTHEQDEDCETDF